MKVLETMHGDPFNSSVLENLERPVIFLRFWKMQNPNQIKFHLAFSRICDIAFSNLRSGLRET